MSIFRLIAGAQGNAKAWNLAYAEYAPSNAWDISTSTYVQNFDVSTQDTSPEGIFFKPDGTKMYIVGDSGDDINEYDLSTSWDVSSASYSQNFSVSAGPKGIFFKPDGTKMYVVRSNTEDIREYDLSTAWDVSSSSFLQGFSVSAQETSPQGLFLKPDGTKMYVVGDTGSDINEYNLSTPWDVSSASYLQNFSVSSQESNPRGLFFKPDGTKMYVIGDNNNLILEYDLSTAWNLSSASYSQFLSISGVETNPTGLFFKPDGTKMYFVGSSGDDVNEYDIGGFSVAAQEATPTGLFFKPDGTKMYVLGSTGDDVNEYDLSTPWDVSSASYLQNFSVAAQEGSAQGLFFKPDGTKMYVVGDSGDEVNEYDLSTPWDVSSASYLQNFSISAQEANPTGLFFKPDGTKMYVVGAAGDDINEYDLSTPWDVSSASYSQNFDVSAQEATPTGLFFKPDGTKMYVLGSTGDDVNEYDLSTPWDVSSASYLQNFSVAAQEGSAQGLFFKPDGTKMYVIGSDTDSIYEYTFTA